MMTASEQNPATDEKATATPVTTACPLTTCSEPINWRDRDSIAAHRHHLPAKYRHYNGLTCSLHSDTWLDWECPFTQCD